MQSQIAFAIFLTSFVLALPIRIAVADELDVRKMLPSATAIYLEINSDR